MQEHITSFNFVIFGSDGDLATRKIIPALYQRFIDGQVDVNHNLLCITRSGITKIFLKSRIAEIIGLEPSALDEFFRNVKLLDIPNNTIDDYSELRNIILSSGHLQTVYYFSVPSSAFSEICNALNESNLINERSKVVLEKPLGNNLKTSEEINNIISASFEESQIFRIDHYLGKETVQNLMVLRFANHLFERAWNAENIDNIQITVAESLGVEKRAGYYDQTGALLDMVQNHLLQLLCLVAMEPPASLDADTVRTEKLKVLKSLRRFDKDSITDSFIRGQYTRGKVKGKDVHSYLEDIEKYDSNTETFVALKVFIDNWRWKNTPFYLRTGKRMKKRYSDIVINFKQLPHSIFPNSNHSLRNKLIIRLQPDERIELVQLSKIPGPGGYRFKPISLKLDFLDSFNKRMPDAYERLIIDVLRGNQTLFMRHDELVEAWKWIESITSQIKRSKMTLYEAGSWGPGDYILNEKTTWQTK